MNNTQQPIASGFTASSTAAQVLQGLKMSGYCALVSGGHSGLGLETTRALAAAGAQVLVGARDPQAARRQLQSTPNCTVLAKQMDLAVPTSPAKSAID